MFQAVLGHPSSPKPGIVCSGSFHSPPKTGINQRKRVPCFFEKNGQPFFQLHVCKPYVGIQKENDMFSKASILEIRDSKEVFVLPKYLSKKPLFNGPCKPLFNTGLGKDDSKTPFDEYRGNQLRLFWDPYLMFL